MGTVDTSLFDPSLVFFDFEARDSAEFFEKMAQILVPRGYVAETWLDAIKVREANYPTGLNCETIEVAIPHVEPEHILKPYIAVIKPKTRIPFGAMGGMQEEPVQAQLILNLGLQAHAEDQVAVLQALMGLFMDQAGVDAILSQTTAQGMVDTIVAGVEAAE